MTKALEQAFREASKLPETEQDGLAEAIRTEIMAKEDWEESFRKSQGVLEELAEEALTETPGEANPPG
jgi:hypothetical protein